MMANSCGPAMILWALLLLGLIAGGVWLAARAFRGGDDAPSRGESSATRILEERFARGEIDGEEFDERRRTLET